jgi:predicted dehydrogenase
MKRHTPTRRQFLKTSALAAGAACSILPDKVLGANNRVNVGIIGAGWKGAGHAKFTRAGSEAGGHLKAFSELDNVNVIAISDPDKMRMDIAGTGVAKHQDLRALLDMKDLDAVVIATPNHWHSLAAIMACQAGKHVYVEKPVSHNIFEGRQLVRAAQKYNRIVQAGTQHRTCPAVQDCAADIQSGKYGKVRWVHCAVLGARTPIDKVSEPTAVPENIDYDLWAGPAPKTPVMRKEFHYDWHWQWNWGNGETGNWGVHYIDDVRHMLGWDDVPTSVISAGNRWWDDDGQTPNMHLSLMEHRGIKVVVDIRNMKDPMSGGDGGAVYLGSRGGNYIACEEGFIRMSRGGGKAYNWDGKLLKQYKGTGGTGHDQNFIDAIRAGSNASLNCEITVGHQSTVMCHLANIAYQLGKSTPLEQMREQFKGHEDAQNTIDSYLAQIDGRVDLSKEPFVLGPKLAYDNNTEVFIGERADEANRLARGTSRKPFVVPENV